MQVLLRVCLLLLQLALVALPGGDLVLCIGGDHAAAHCNAEDSDEACDGSAERPARSEGPVHPKGHDDCDGIHLALGEGDAWLEDGKSSRLVGSAPLAFGPWILLWGDLRPALTGQTVSWCTPPVCSVALEAVRLIVLRI